MKKQKDTFTIETVSEDLREGSAAADDSFSEARKSSVTFRKVFKGFDEVEVLQYIEDQEEAFKSASSIYERTLEDSKSENTLLRRENKALKQNIAELEEKIKELEEGKPEPEGPVPDEEGFIAEPISPEHGIQVAAAATNAAEAADKSSDKEMNPEIAEYAAKVSELQAQVATLEGENEELKAALAQAKASLAALEADRYAAGNEQLMQAQATIAELNDKLAANEELLKDKEAQLIAVAPAAVVSDDAAANEKIAALEAQLAAKTAECEKAVADFERFKREAGDSVVMADTYTKQAEKLTAELTELRAVNQKQAYEYAEKLSTLEAQTSTDRAKVSQQMKMHTYHLRQIDALLAQLTEQFELAREAVEEL